MSRLRQKLGNNPTHNSLKKYVEIKLSKDVKGLCSENCRTLKKLEKTPEDRKTSQIHGQQNQHCEKGYTPKSNLQIQHNSYVNGIA
jgi:DNA-directed RNA polymerase specialized sigma subunit